MKAIKKTMHITGYPENILKQLATFNNEFYSKLNNFIIIS